MSLREQARADAIAITQSTSDFGWPVTVTNPDGTSAELTGFAGDVAIEEIDADGQIFTGRRAYVSLTMDQFAALGTPRAEVDGDSSPWIIEFEDAEGTPRVYTILECKPDRALGLFTMTLKDYRRL